VSFEPWQWVLIVLGAFSVGVAKTGIAGLGILFAAIMANLMPTKEASGFVLPLLIVGDGKALTLIDYEVRQVQRWPISNSPLGALLDPLGDRLLLIVVGIALVRVGIVPLWPVALLVLREAGLLRPAQVPLLSWEQALFELSRGPWVLAGALAAVREWLRPRPLTFLITRKDKASTSLPLAFLSPYLLAVLIGVGAAVSFGPSSRLARGYVLLTLLSTTMFAITALAVAVLSHRQSNRSLHGHLPQMGLASAAVLLTLGCGLWRLPDLLAPLQLSHPIPFLPS
jgi:hypothetical protein